MILYKALAYVILGNAVVSLALCLIVLADYWGDLKALGSQNGQLRATAKIGVVSSAVLAFVMLIACAFAILGFLAPDPSPHRLPYTIVGRVLFEAVVAAVTAVKVYVYLTRRYLARAGEGAIKEKS